MSTVTKIKDPELGEIYRATCHSCPKTFESKYEQVVVNNIIAHRAVHNGHR